MAKISGPLLDRIDLQIEVPFLSYKKRADPTPSESSAVIQERVNKARAIQQQRFSRAKIYYNSQMASRHLRSWCQVDEKSHSLLERAIDKMGLPPASRRGTRLRALLMPE
jgi:magnesium chelatase family protein